MKDVDPEPETETAYECFECGNIVIADVTPDRCADCGGPMRNRQMPLE